MVTLSFSMMCTIPPHPAEASRSQAFISAWETLSNSWSGFMSSNHRVSHIPEKKNGRSERFHCWHHQLRLRYLCLPNSCSSAVPPTTKSLGLVMHPIRSMEQMKGSPLTGSNPATIGSTKKGPNLRSYSMLDSMEANVLGFIFRPSFSS